MNQLTRLSDFQQVLANYQPSPEATALLKNLRLVLLVGPSSSGRNTIISELLKSGKYHFIVSDTTRQPRLNDGVLEQNGNQYWFRAEADILHDLQTGQFLEAAIIHEQQVSGISIRELATAADKGRIAINEVEVAGADNIQAAKPDTLFIFVLPPSFDEWLVRMQNRGAIPAEEVRRRLQSAVDEISRALNRDYYQFVVNDTFMQTTKQIDNLVRGQERQDEDQAKGRQVAERVLQDTKKYLAQLAD